MIAKVLEPLRRDSSAQQWPQPGELGKMADLICHTPLGREETLDELHCIHRHGYAQGAMHILVFEFVIVLLMTVGVLLWPFVRGLLS